MIRIALFILLFLVILVALKFPQFRRTLGVAMLGLMGVIGLIIWQDTQERNLEFNRIQAEQVQLSQMEVRAGLNARSFVIGGRLQSFAKNYTILSIELQATVKDCHQDVCEIVGQGTTVFPLEVPPSQSRDFSVTIPFSVVPKVKGEAVWRYEILQIRAR